VRSFNPQYQIDTPHVHVEVFGCWTGLQNQTDQTTWTRTIIRIPRTRLI